MVLLLLATVSFAQQVPADKIIGVWESVDSGTKLKFEFFPSGNSYFGKLLFASSMVEADGKAIKKDLIILIRVYKAGRDTA